MMLAFKILFLDCVISRRGISNTAFSLWPCQKHYLKLYIVGIVFFLFTFLQVAQVTGEETVAPAGPLAATESPPPKTPASMTDIHDIHPPVSVGIDAPWLVPSLLALAAALILTAGWWFWKKRNRNRAVETIVPELPPELTAMQALDHIADVRRLDGKTFYFRLSAILRQYVFGRFAVGAPEMTTEEFIPRIDRLNMDKGLAQRLRVLCRAIRSSSAAKRQWKNRWKRICCLPGNLCVKPRLRSMGMIKRMVWKKTPCSHQIMKIPKNKSQISNKSQTSIFNWQPRSLQDHVVWNLSFGQL